MGTPKRNVFLTDLHVPFNINLSPVLKFIHDFQPHEVILGGDVHDWTAVAHWIADQSRNLNGQIIKNCYRQMHRVVLDPIREAAPNAKVIYLEGNHEYWLTKAIEICPNGAGFWELQNNIKLKKYNMEIVPINVPYKASPHLYYMHGVYTNDFHAKKTALSYQKSVLYGHSHDCQEYTIVSPLDVGHVIKARSVGCLCTRNPHYLRNKPNRWVNGFNYAYIDEDTGFFNEYQVNIVCGGFWANDKRYD